MLSSRRTLPALALAAGGLAVAVPLASADEPTVFDTTYSFTGMPQSLTLPDGVTTVDVVAIGARGGGRGVAGGRGARVDAALPVTPRQPLWIHVGGHGAGGFGVAGGFNGGGSALTDPLGGATGAGGGGATDLRTEGDGSLAARVLVAGGGGGAGATANGGGGVGGSGGDAGAEGAGGAGTGAGGGGGAATTSAGGGAGSGGSGSIRNGNAGEAGTSGIGGTGGSAGTNTPSGWGGGGGGGLWGGGGGGGAGFSGNAGGGGGGGGGSSLVPAGGTVRVADAGDEPSLRISYTLPGTTVLGAPAPVTNAAEPEIAFEATAAGATYDCRIDGTDGDPFRPCTSPLRLGGLADGAHRVEIRATAADGNFDPTPAVVAFVRDTVAPAATVVAGPDGETEATRPAFAVAVDEAGATLSCRFDGGASLPCEPGAPVVPAADLAVGPHTFTVDAIDAAGNAGPRGSRSFTVVAPSLPPGAGDPGGNPGGGDPGAGGGAPPSGGGPGPAPGGDGPGTSRPDGGDGGPQPGGSRPAPARIALTAGTTVRARGASALLALRLNGAGRVVVAGSRTVAPTSRKLRRAGVARLSLRLKRPALRTLRTRGRVTMRVRVSFTRADGGRAARTIRLTVRVARR